MNIQYFIDSSKSLYIWKYTDSPKLEVSGLIPTVGLKKTFSFLNYLFGTRFYEAFLTALLGYLSILLEYIDLFSPTPERIISARYHFKGG